ncbi:MAG TPA: hypothetical protein VFN08_08910 [Gemmatimonadales bacterium]|nr:hypothetical protein [Gemmatimonadales bacterium]
MPRALRSPRLACLTLAAFLVAQPVVGCALLCLADNHHALHDMVGMTQPSAAANSACHTGVDNADRHAQAQTLSFMEPAAEYGPARVAVVSVQVPVALVAAAPRISPSLDPPPPRLV